MPALRNVASATEVIAREAEPERYEYRNTSGETVAAGPKTVVTETANSFVPSGAHASPRWRSVVADEPKSYEYRSVWGAPSANMSMSGVYGASLPAANKPNPPVVSATAFGYAPVTYEVVVSVR